MRTKVFPCFGMIALSGLICMSCSNNSSIKEPQECIDGYSIQRSMDRWIIVNPDGKETFEGKMITTDDGEQVEGGRLSFRETVYASVNGFYKMGHSDWGREYRLLSKELDSDGKLIYLGPYESVGMFYEDITPAAKKGESIMYINRKGETVIDINKSTGLDVYVAYNFMGGLSVIGITAENGTPRCGAINTKGEIVIEPKYVTLNYFGSGLYWGIAADKFSENCDVDVLDNTGKEMFSFKAKDYYIKYDNRNNGPISFPFKDGYGVLSDYSGYNWVIVDREGNELLKSDGTKRISKDYEDRLGKHFVFEDDEIRCYGIMDIKGNVVVPAEYSRIGWLGKDMFLGMKDGEYSVYDYKGNVLIDNYCIPFKDGYSCIKEQGWIKFINKKGEKVNQKKWYDGFYYYDPTLLEPVWSNAK